MSNRLMSEQTQVVKCHLQAFNVLPEALLLKKTLSNVLICHFKAVHCTVSLVFIQWVINVTYISKSDVRVINYK